MSEESSVTYTTPAASAKLKEFDRLIGTWTVSDPTGNEGISGSVRFEWMEGGFFLIQHVDLDHGGNIIKGIEYIGLQNGWEEMMNPPDPDAEREITSHYFDNLGNTFNYVWEIDADTLTIWGGYKGSPSKYVGKFSADGDVNTGAWEYPGGGYESMMSRVK